MIMERQNSLKSFYEKNKTWVYLSLFVIVGLAIINYDKQKTKVSSGTGSGNPVPKKEGNDVKVETPRNTWSYSREVNEMGDSLIVARLFSDGIVHLSYPYNGGSVGKLLLRRQNKNLDIMFSVSKGQINFPYGGLSVRVRFDDGPPVRYSTARSETNDTEIFFFNNEASLLKKIEKCKKMVIEVPFYSHGNEMFVFRTEGLEFR
jgi:hypothetical protein